MVSFFEVKRDAEYKNLGNTGLDHYFHWAAKRRTWSTGMRDMRQTVVIKCAVSFESEFPLSFVAVMS